MEANRRAVIISSFLLATAAVGLFWYFVLRQPTSQTPQDIISSPPQDTTVALETPSEWVSDDTEVSPEEESAEEPVDVETTAPTGASAFLLSLLFLPVLAGSVGMLLIWRGPGTSSLPQ